MRVLISAYACEPGKGSEPEVGLRTVLAAAKHHEVWVLTRRNNVSRLETYLAGRSERERITIFGHDLSERHLSYKKRFPLGTQLYYDLWQRSIAPIAKALDARIGFDVAHHATFASYWTRHGVAVVDKPIVIGPVGGGVPPPLRLLPVLGAKGILEDALRLPGRRAVRRLTGSTRALQRARIVLSQNRETARRLPRRALVVPNALAVHVPPDVLPPTGERTEIAFVGRLIPLKAARLAIRAMRYVRHRRTVLHIYGDGPDRGAIERCVRRWRLQERVAVVGQLPRDEVLRRVAASAVLIHPAVHDEASLAVAEALSLGTPVVCLAHGGPGEVVRWWPGSRSTTIRPDWPTPTARRMGAAIDELLRQQLRSPLEPLAPDPTFEEVLMRVYADAACGTSGATKLRPNVELRWRSHGQD